MNLFDQLNVAFETTFGKPAPSRKTQRGNNKPWLTQQQRAEDRYRNMLTGNTMTTGEITARLGYSHMGGLSSLYRLEQRGLVKRVGTVPRPPGMRKGRGQTLWTWVGDAS